MKAVLVTLVVVSSFVLGCWYTAYNNHITKSYEDGSFVGCARGAICNE